MYELEVCCAVVVSSSHFPFRGQTDRQTDRHTNSQSHLNALCLPWLLPLWVLITQHAAHVRFHPAYVFQMEFLLALLC